MRLSLVGTGGGFIPVEPRVLLRDDLAGHWTCRVDGSSHHVVRTPAVASCSDGQMRSYSQRPRKRSSLSSRPIPTSAPGRAARGHRLSNVRCGTPADASSTRSNRAGPERSFCRRLRAGARPTPLGGCVNVRQRFVVLRLQRTRPRLRPDRTQKPPRGPTPPTEHSDRGKIGHWSSYRDVGKTANCPRRLDGHGP